jgi:hypothetical protein
LLPWAKRVPAILAHPRATLPVLDALHRDESEYVRRSVANHLNDLSRQQPGTHAIELQLNGVVSGRTEFTLLEADQVVAAGSPSGGDR